MADHARLPDGRAESNSREAYRRRARLVVGARDRDATLRRVLDLLVESVGAGLAAIVRHDGEVLRPLRWSAGARYDIRDGDEMLHGMTIRSST